jgi:hypothetical protein
MSGGLSIGSRSPEPIDASVVRAGYDRAKAALHDSLQQRKCRASTLL